MIRIGGLARSFTVRLPQGPAVGDEVPLVLMLHGNRSGFAEPVGREWTPFEAQVDKWGVAVAYPDGYGSCWADGRGVTTADEACVDDVAFLRAVIDWSAERHGTSRDRTIVAGISNGAFMAHRLALAASDQVAVLAAVAGGLPAALSGLRPSHAVSALLINGTDDKLVPIEGGYSRRRGPNGELRGRTLSLRDTAEYWRTVDRCDPGPGVTTTTPPSDRPGVLGTSRCTVTGGVGGTQVAAWTVHGGGHTWPGSPSTPEIAAFAGPTAQDFDAAAEICRFALPLLGPATARAL